MDKTSKYDFVFLIKNTNLFYRIKCCSIEKLYWNYITKCNNFIKDKIKYKFLKFQPFSKRFFPSKFSTNLQVTLQNRKVLSALWRKFTISIMIPIIGELIIDKTLCFKNTPFNLLVGQFVCNNFTINLSAMCLSYYFRSKTIFFKCPAVCLFFRPFL